jgi:hypothetical protein
MKNILVLVLSLLLGQWVNAQAVSIGKIIAPPDPSAVLDLQSKDKGLLIPRVFSENLPSNPADGLIIYRVDLEPGFLIFENGKWKKLLASDGTAILWTLNDVDQAVIDRTAIIGDIGGNSMLQVNGSFDGTIINAEGINGTMLVVRDSGVAIGEFENSPPQDGLYVKGQTSIGSNSPLGALNLTSPGDLGASTNVVPSTAALTIGSSFSGMYFDNDQIETNSGDLKLQDNSTKNVVMTNGGGNVGIGPNVIPQAHLQVSPNGDMGKFSPLDITHATLAIGSSSVGMYLDGDQIETKGRDLIINGQTDNDIIMASGQGSASVGFPRSGLVFPKPVARLQVNPKGNLAVGGVLVPENAGVMVGEPNFGLMIDANQIETTGGSMLLNHVSDENVLAVTGGGFLGIGEVSPAAKVDIAASDWQIKLKNTTDASADKNDWFMGASGSSWFSGQDRFIISPAQSSSQSILTLHQDGQVGIGTVNPENRLEINGGSPFTLTEGGFLQLGKKTTSNLVLDDNGISARNNGLKTPLFLNDNSGGVCIGPCVDTPLSHLSVVGGNSGFSQGEIYMDVFTAGPDGDPYFRIEKGGGFQFWGGHGYGGDQISFTLGSDNGIYMYDEGTELVLRPKNAATCEIGTSSFPFKNTFSQSFFAFTPFNYLAYSDRRIKENIKSISGALSTIKQIEGVSYALKEDYFYKSATAPRDEFQRTHQLGFIAQDIEKVLPQIVNQDDGDGLKSIGYIGLIPIMVEAIKELSAEQDELKKLVMDQKKLIEEQRSLIMKLASN